MNFDLGETHKMLQDNLRRYLADAAGHEKAAAATDSGTGFDADLWSGLVEMGIPGAMFAEDAGGFGGGGFDIMVVFRELGVAGAVTPLLESAVLAGGILAGAGAGFAPHVEKIIGGAVYGFAHGEPRSRYDLAHIETTAEKSGDGKAWKLKGQKAVVYHAPAAEAFVVSARENGKPGDEDGLSLFLVPKDSVQMRDYPVYGSGRAAELTLDCEVPQDALIGAAGKAFAVIETAQARGIAALGAEALGLMETARNITLAYLGQRKQFGQPIGNFQALQFRMADVLMEIEQARSAVINLCGNLESPRDVRELNVSATKNMVGRAGRLTTEEAIQMHGGMGMTNEYMLGHFAKRLTMMDHRFGDSDFHLERYIAFAAAS